MSQVEIELQEFRDDLDRANELLNLVKAFRDFAGAEIPEAVKSGEVTWPEASSLSELAPNVRTDLPVLAGAILLYVCGRFESFVRDVVAAIADEMAAKAATYIDLPEPFRKEMLDRTIDIVQAPARYGYDETTATSLLTSLATNLMGSNNGQVLISSRVLTITETNMTSQTLAKVFKRLGITDLWRDLGKQARLKTHLGQQTDGQCTAEAQIRLDSHMRDRNRFAHPTGQVSFPDPDQVLEATAFMAVLSEVLVDVVQVPR